MKKKKKQVPEVTAAERSAKLARLNKRIKKATTDMLCKDSVEEDLYHAVRKRRARNARMLSRAVLYGMKKRRKEGGRKSEFITFANDILLNTGKRVMETETQSRKVQDEYANGLKDWRRLHRRGSQWEKKDR